MLDLHHLYLEYAPAFELLIEDFDELLAFIEPVDANLQTYSHRTYELFLRASTEFESLCKQALVATGSKKDPRQMNVNDYRELEKDLNLEDLEVGILIWRPKPVYVKPFASWKTAAPALAWYSEYNTVKHNRNTEFPHASFANLRLAISAVYALHIELRFPDRTCISTRGWSDTNYDETIFDAHPYSKFSFRRPAKPQ